MTKTLNQIFVFLHQNQNIFFSNIGNQNIFLDINHNPTPFKLNGPSLRTYIHVFMYAFKKKRKKKVVFRLIDLCLMTTYAVFQLYRGTEPV
jgi:hypothetical protein